jgi:hypothetical protein
MSSVITRLIHLLLKKLFHNQISETNTNSHLIINELLSEKPLMIARFGSTEIKAIIFP